MIFLHSVNDDDLMADIFDEFNELKANKAVLSNSHAMDFKGMASLLTLA